LGFILFDALDECSRENFEDIIDLMGDLREAGVKLFCTSRLNTSEIRAQLGTPSLIEVKAHHEDVVRYLSARLSKEWKYDDEIKQELLNTLARKAFGKLLSH
jgi:hypothetical protein